MIESVAAAVARRDARSCEFSLSAQVFWVADLTTLWLTSSLLTFSAAVALRSGQEELQGLQKARFFDTASRALREKGGFVRERFDWASVGLRETFEKRSGKIRHGFGMASAILRRSKHVSRTPAEQHSNSCRTLHGTGMLLTRIQYSATAKNECRMDEKISSSVTDRSIPVIGRSNAVSILSYPNIELSLNQQRRINFFLKH